MAVDSILVKCGSCYARLDEDPHAPTEQRRPCPHCGSLLRQVNLHVSETITLRSKLTAKGRHAGEKRPFVEQIVGDDLHRKSGRWMRLHRVIDRVRDWYYERVTDPATEQVVHECDEPLTEHRGNGSAKSKGNEGDGVDA